MDNPESNSPSPRPDKTDLSAKKGKNRPSRSNEKSGTRSRSSDAVPKNPFPFPVDSLPAQEPKKQICERLALAAELLDTGAWDSTLDLCRSCLLQIGELPHPDRESQGWQARCFEMMGAVSLQLDDTKEARKFLEQAAAGFETLESGAALAETLTLLGRVCLLDQDLERAMDSFRQAAHRWDREGYPAECGLAWLELAGCLAEAGETRAAERHVKQGLHRVDTSGNAESRIRARQLAATVYRLNGQQDELIGQLEARCGLQQSFIHTLQEREKVNVMRVNEPIKNDQAYFDAIRTFTGKAAHDMKEPLRMIGSFSSLLQRNYGAALDHEGHEFLDIVIDANARMSDLLNNLLEYTRLGSSEQPVSRVELTDIALLAANRIATLLKQKQATLETLTLPCVQGQAGYLEQMLVQLLDNSLKFNRNKNPKIRIEAETENDFTVLCVHDNGIGITRSQREEVFALFRRLHPRTEYRGSGIGLAIVARVAELHGGTCQVEDSPLGGCSIRVKLPLAG